MPSKPYDIPDAARRELVYRHLFFSKEGRGTNVPCVMKPNMIAALDAWREAFYEAGGNKAAGMMTRSQAIRWMLVEYLMLDET
jgi:hypothetical protein